MIDEKKLSEDCKRQNPLAQKELYDNYCEVVLGLCFRYVADSIVAEDLMQDTFIKVLTKIEKFNWKGNGSLGAWIRKIAVNTCLSFLENKKKTEKKLNESILQAKELIEQEYYLDDPESTEAESSTIDFEIIKNAGLTEKELLETLILVPEPFRNVFNLHVIEGYKHEEVAEMLGINKKTSRTRLLRARKLLKENIYRISVERVTK